MINVGIKVCLVPKADIQAATVRGDPGLTLARTRRCTSLGRRCQDSTTKAQRKRRSDVPFECSQRHAGHSNKRACKWGWTRKSDRGCDLTDGQRAERDQILRTLDAPL